MRSYHQIAWIPTAFLKPHEALKERAAGNFLRFARRTRVLRTRPILIDRKTGVILDGHHRYWICKRLGCSRVPCVAVNYLRDRSIRVVPRRKDTAVSKEAVLRMGLSGETFPPKTTKHLYTIPAMEVWVPLTKFLPSSAPSSSA